MDGRLFARNPLKLNVFQMPNIKYIQYLNYNQKSQQTILLSNSYGFFMTSYKTVRCFCRRRSLMWNP